MTKDELRAWMNGHNLSATRLAELLPVPKKTVDNWVQGRFPTPPLLPRALHDIERELIEKKS